jgi:archaellum biogenesis ATPase FlaH
VLALDNYVSGMFEEHTIAGLSHMYPLLLKMVFQPSAVGDMQRVMQLGKLRSGMFSGDRQQFRIDPRAGIVVQR